MATPQVSAAPEPQLRRPRDLIFVLDSSGSIPEEDLDRALTFTRRIVGLLDVSQTGTRVAMVNFGSNAKVEFSLHHHSTEEQIQKALQKVDPLGGSTNTSAALEKVLKMCEKRHNMDHPLIVILITDGHSDNRARATQTAASLKHKWGAHFFAVGVGNAVNRAELSALASSDENVLLVDSYRALKHVREKVATKLCTVVRRPKFNGEITSLAPAKKVLFLGFKWTSSQADVARQYTQRAIRLLRQADPDASKIKICFLTLEAQDDIDDSQKAEADSDKIVLLGSRPPMGCSLPPSTADADVFVTAFFQHALHSSLLSDVTHVFGEAPFSANAMHNIADALRDIHQSKPKRVVIVTDATITPAVEKAEAILCVDNVAEVKKTLGSTVQREVLFLNLQTGTQPKEELVAVDHGEPSDVVLSPSSVLLHSITDGIELEIRLFTSEADVDICKAKLQLMMKVIRSILETGSSDDSKNVADESDAAAIGGCQEFLASVQEKNRTIITATTTDPLTLKMSLFCTSEENVKDLWENFKWGNPATKALHQALELSGVNFEICEVVLKSESARVLIGSAVHSSERYVRHVARVISARKKAQDAKWTTMHGLQKDRKIAQEIESRRLEKRWAAVEEAAREVMGERGVEALQRARDQSDDEEELLLAIEQSIEAGGLLEFLKDIVTKLCRIM